MISQRFVAAVKLSEKRQYRIAQEADLHPTTLSRIMCGITRVEPGDPRVLQIARVVGLGEDDCFENETQAI